MRTIQILRTNNAFDAVGAAIIFATAPLWIPVLVLVVGYQLAEEHFGFGDHAPAKVAQRQRAEQAKAAEEAARRRYVKRDDAGRPVWTGTEGELQRAVDVLPVSNPHKPVLHWAVADRDVAYILSDELCRFSLKNNWEAYRYKNSAGASGCYAIRNGVIGIRVGSERVVFFDVKDAIELDQSTPAKPAPATPAKVEPAKVVPVRVTPTKAAKEDPEPRCADIPCAQAKLDRAMDAFIKAGGKGDSYGAVENASYELSHLRRQ